MDSWLKNPQYSSDGVTLDVIPTQDTATLRLPRPARHAISTASIISRLSFPITQQTETES